MHFVFLYVTCTHTLEARSLSRLLLQKNLIACANIFPMESIYWWEGKIVSGKEAVLILKTSRNKVVRTRAEIEKMHSYKVPCITEIHVKPNAKYARWWAEQLG